MGTKRLAIWDGQETTAHKDVNGRWFVGGDFAPMDGTVLIAALCFSNGRYGWHKLQGNRLVFQDFLTEAEIAKQEYIGRYA